MARGWRIWTALWIVYIVWGSTYLAIKVSVETMPPLLSAGLRFVLAGLLLAGILSLRRTSLRVRRQELAAAVGLGIALLACGVGVVTLAETRIDSSIAAMIAGLGAAAGDRVAHDCARASRDGDQAECRGRARRAGADRRPERRLGRLRGGRAGADARCVDLVVDRLVLLAQAAPSRRTRSWPRSTRCSAAGSCSSSPRWRSEKAGTLRSSRDLGGIARGMALPRGRSGR